VQRRILTPTGAPGADEGEVFDDRAHGRGAHGTGGSTGSAAGAARGPGSPQPSSWQARAGHAIAVPGGRTTPPAPVAYADLVTRIIAWPPDAFILGIP
jgi:hypothetical protein